VFASTAATAVYTSQVEPASAQISDIHMGTGMTRSRLLRMIEQLNAESPDLVVVDYFRSLA
jgi:predicted MPP superfamily phosphohydrolase